MIANLPTYDEARKAIRGGNDPMAFLHLGVIYANGIGITQNHILACYFFRKALDLGCQEAEEYLNMEYESGIKDFADIIEFDDNCKAIIYINCEDTHDFLHDLALNMISKNKFSSKGAKLVNITNEYDEYDWNERERAIIQDAINFLLKLKIKI